jgi:hypothetical protein
VVVAVAAALLVWRMGRSGEREAALTGQFTEWPGEATVAQPAKVTLTLTNNSARPIQGFQVRVPARVLRHFELGQMQPPPTSTEQRGSARYLVYDAEVPAEGTYTVFLSLSPASPGDQELDLGAWTAAGQLIVRKTDKLSVTP